MVDMLIDDSLDALNNGVLGGKECHRWRLRRHGRRPVLYTFLSVHNHHLTSHPLAMPFLNQSQGTTINGDSFYDITNSHVHEPRDEYHPVNED